MNIIYQLIYTVPAVLIAISMHEFAHGYVSYKLGDPSPKYDGRLSVNPLRHLDPMGTLFLLIFHFGWAKPVMVNPSYYTNKKRGMVMVALAGPVMNFFVAFISFFTMGLFFKFLSAQSGMIAQYIFQLLHFTMLINIGLGVFNLIPVPPLDGSKVLSAVLPEDKYFSYMRYERYGQILLVLLLVFNILDTPLAIVRSGITNLMWFVVRFILRL